MSTTTEYFSLLAHQISDLLAELPMKDMASALEADVKRIERGATDGVDRLYNRLSSDVKLGSCESEAVAPVLALLSDNRDRYTYFSELYSPPESFSFRRESGFSEGSSG